MRDLWFYRWMCGFGFLNYRAKIMVMAFLGTHIPLIALACYFAFQTSPDWNTFVITVGITLIATLLGTGLTLFVLNELLRPVIKTSKALRAYRDNRTLSNLPIHFTDEVGTLMADAGTTITHLEAVRDALENIDLSTGLMNRKRLVEILERRVSQTAAFSVAVLRVANMPRILEAFDAENAETMMKLIADRLRQAVPEGSDLARIGSAEFSIIFPATSSLQAADELAGVISASDADISFDTLTMKPDLFSGIAAFPTDAGDATMLLDHAVAAAATANLAEPTTFHSPEARARSIERLRMELQLRRALEHDEFRLHYQPVVDLSNGLVRGAEALIRWQRPESGLVLPGLFIPTAESSGLIDPIGLWVLREVCSQIGMWNEQGRDDIKVAINLSARQFLDPDLKNHIAEALASSRSDPSQLEIELTETAVMADHDHTRKVFTELRDLGVSIAIDDFGTGYAGMSYLRKLPFDKLKIDREFVTDVHKRPDSQAICKALVALSNGLGLKVLAEGTETEEEVRFLNEIGCDLFQGFYFAKPLAHEEFCMAIDSIALRTMIKKMAPKQTSRKIVHTR